MTKKNFIALAALLHEHKPQIQSHDPAVFDLVVDLLCAYCQEQNRKFDPERFRQAAHNGRTKTKN